MKLYDFDLVFEILEKFFKIINFLNWNWKFILF